LQHAHHAKGRQIVVREIASLQEQTQEVQLCTVNTLNHFVSEGTYLSRANKRMLEEAELALATINGAAECDGNRNTHNKQESGHNEIRDCDTIPTKTKTS